MAQNIDRSESGSRPAAACPVCRGTAARPLMRIDSRDYWWCSGCGARFLDRAQLPSADEEHRHYRLHENDPGDPRYRQFLSRLACPLLERMPAGLGGLDYGCGPGPALAAMLREAGHAMAVYDPFFWPDEGALGRTYDFVTCTETAEHFHRPADEFDRLDRLLAPGGWLGLMTCFQTEDARFAGWHYRKDPTHVVFYREATLRTLAAQRRWTCEIPAKDVAIMRKPPHGRAG